MQIKCNRRCKNRVRNGDCLLKDIVIEENGCNSFEAIPDFEPYRADNVVIFDEAGIPSIMVRFSRTTDKELFGGPDKVHPAFVIEDEVYDEIYISKYPNIVIDGRAYSLPLMDIHRNFASNISFDKAVEVCRNKGKGWHLMTAAERGLLINLCHKNGTFPKGNIDTPYSHDWGTDEAIKITDTRITLPGSGPNFWNHDSTPFGVVDLCGNLREQIAGMRVVKGIIEIIKNNDAAANVDMSRESKEWVPMETNKGSYCFYSRDARISDEQICCDISGTKHVNGSLAKATDGITVNGLSFVELGLCGYEENAKISAYVNELGEYLPVCGGAYYSKGVACMSDIAFVRTRNDEAEGCFRSAYYRKK